MIPDDDQALTVAGKRKNLFRRSWKQLAESAGIPARAAERILALPSLHLQSALSMVEASALREDFRASYRDLLTTRAALR